MQKWSAVNILSLINLPLIHGSLRPLRSEPLETIPLRNSMDRAPRAHDRIRDRLRAHAARPAARLFDSHSFRVFATVFEQGVFAGTNFFVTILLVRWMPVDQVGAYSFGFSIFLLSVMLFESLLVEPIPIFGSGKFAAQISVYTGAILYGHVVIGAVVCSALLALAALLYSHSAPLLADAIAGAAIAAPFLFLRPVTQQLCYTNARNGAFAVAGVAYAFVAPALLYALHLAGRLGPAGAFLALGAATAIPCVPLIVFLLRPKLHPKDIRPVLGQIIADHLRYGQWSSLAQATYWLGTNIYYLVGPAVIGLDATAAVRAIFNLTLPILMASGAIVSTFNPALARLKFAGDAHRSRQLVWSLAAGLLLLTAGYAVALLLGGRQAMSFIYGNVFDGFITFPLIVCLAVIPMLTALSCVLELELRVSGKIKWVAAAKGLWAISTLTIGVGACVAFGLTGVFAGWAFNSALLLAANAWCCVSKAARAEPVHTDTPPAES